MSQPSGVGERSFTLSDIEDFGTLGRNYSNEILFGKNRQEPQKKQ
jgi:hypothetical protein